MPFFTLSYFIIYFAFFVGLEAWFPDINFWVQIFGAAAPAIVTWFAWQGLKLWVYMKIVRARARRADRKAVTSGSG